MGCSLRSAENGWLWAGSPPGRSERAEESLDVKTSDRPSWEATMPKSVQDRLGAGREEASDAHRAEEMDEQRRVNRLLRDPEPPQGEQRHDIESAGHE